MSRAVEPLVAALRDRSADERVRQAAADALEKIGPPAVEPLVAALRIATQRRVAVGDQRAGADRGCVRRGAIGGGAADSNDAVRQAAADAW